MLSAVCVSGLRRRRKYAVCYQQSGPCHSQVQRMWGSGVWWAEPIILFWCNPSLFENGDWVLYCWAGWFSCFMETCLESCHAFICLADPPGLFLWLPITLWWQDMLASSTHQGLPPRLVSRWMRCPLDVLRLLVNSFASIFLDLLAVKLPACPGGCWA